MIFQFVRNLRDLCVTNLSERENPPRPIVPCDQCSITRFMDTKLATNPSVIS